ETQLGYVKRVGIREFEQVLELVRRPKGPVVKVGPTFTTLFDWDRDGRLLDRSLEASFEVKLRGETKLVLGREQAFELFADHPRALAARHRGLRDGEPGLDPLPRGPAAPLGRGSAAHVPRQPGDGAVRRLPGWLRKSRDPTRKPARAVPHRRPHDVSRATGVP